MKSRILMMALLPFICVGCFPTRIVTYSPASSSTYYSTTVTAARSNTTTTIAQVYSADEDMSLFLDLQALASLFAQSSTVKEFETMLNSTSYPISNLDLNGDGYIDYLRVIETVEGYDHVFLVQAVLGRDIFQDVATITVEKPALSNWYVEVIGSPFIYGPKYVIKPVFLLKPAIFAHLIRERYEPWRSPWYWDNFPSHYKHPAPIYLNHYQAYIKTFLGSHHYCREAQYPSEPHFSGYDKVIKKDTRNDFGTKHPDKAFSKRNANVQRVGSQSSEKVRNAYDIRQNNESSKVTTTRPNTSNGDAIRSNASKGNGEDSAVSRRRSSTTAGQSRSSTAQSKDSKAQTPSGGSGNVSGGNAKPSSDGSRQADSARPSSDNSNTSGSVKHSGSTKPSSNGSGTSESVKPSGNSRQSGSTRSSGSSATTKKAERSNSSKTTSGSSVTSVRSRVYSSGSSSSTSSATRTSKPSSSSSGRR